MCTREVGRFLLLGVLSHAEAQQRCRFGLCQSPFAHPSYQFASVDFSRGHPSPTPSA